MADKKLTTGGFFRSIIRHAIYGDNENPLTTVVKEGLKHGKAKSKAKVIETEGEESPQADRNPHDEGATG